MLVYRAIVKLKRNALSVIDTSVLLHYVKSRDPIPLNWPTFRESVAE